MFARSNLVFAVHAIADSFNLFKLDAFLPGKSEAHENEYMVNITNILCLLNKLYTPTEACFLSE